jgi:hypothetical protein
LSGAEFDEDKFCDQRQKLDDVIDVLDQQDDQFFPTPEGEA